MPLTTFNSYNSLLFFVLLRENASTDDESTDIILLDPTHPYSHSLHKLDILAKTKQGTENTYCKSFFLLHQVIIWFAFYCLTKAVLLCIYIFFFVMRTKSMILKQQLFPFKAKQIGS